MTETKVLFIWDVPDRLKEYFRKALSGIENVDLIFPDVADEENYLRLAPDADIIVGWRPTRELLFKAEKLKVLINPGAGIKHQIDVFRELNESRNVLLVNGHGNSYFTAQHVVGLLLALMNKIVLHHNWMAAGKWRTGDKDAISLPLRSRTVGLLGYGAVNSKAHKFLSGFDIDFAILRRDWGKQTDNLPTPAQKFGEDELPAFLEFIDTLIIAVPETSRTDGMVGRNELEIFGHDGLIVNIARGSVIDEKSLYECLHDNVIAGAALDVWYDYKPEPDNEGRKFPYSFPFHELDNVVLSPHRGASPMNDLKRWDEVITNIKKVASGDFNLLNLVSLEDEY
jgi:phosphoglycerate dehydrogenase-like enzyme